jgi:sulfur carrier protein ThiS
MKVHLHAFAHLRDYVPADGGKAELILAEGATLADLFAALGIPATVAAVMLVNGRRAAAGTRLNCGDEVTLFPPMEGG